MSDRAVSFTLNGRPASANAADSTVLVDLLRERYGLFGCRIGCDQAVCGACTVLVDDTPMAACSTFAFEVEGRSVLTVEGLAAPDGTLDPVQQAFLDARGFQCGYCTAGMMLLTRSLLRRHPDPDEPTIRAWLGAGVCRCTGYSAIIEAVQAAARLQRDRSAA